MKLTRREAKSTIELLMAQLSPWGVNNSEQLAMLLRDGDSDNPTFPSGGYIRLMQSAKGPEPSERFCDRLIALSEYVGRALAANDPDLALITNRLIVTDNSFDPAKKLKWVVVPWDMAISQIYTAREIGETPVVAVIPQDWLTQCWECGVWFASRAHNARYCKPCGRIHRNEQARERKRKERERQQEYDAASAMSIGLRMARGINDLKR